MSVYINKWHTQQETLWFTCIYFLIYNFIFELVHKKNPLTISAKIQTQDDMEEINHSLNQLIS
jgi:hypothetical protein